MAADIELLLLYELECSLCTPDSDIYRCNILLRHIDREPQEEWTKRTEQKDHLNDLSADQFRNTVFLQVLSFYCKHC